MSADFKDAETVSAFIRTGFGSARASHPPCFISQTKSQGHPRFKGGKQSPPLEWALGTERRGGTRGHYHWKLDLNFFIVHFQLMEYSTAMKMTNHS